MSLALPAKEIILAVVLLSSIGISNATFGNVLIEDESQMVRSDQPLLLQEGYVLSIQDVSPNGDKVWLVLQKHDFKSDWMGHMGDTINFRLNKVNNESEKDILLFSARIDAMFKNENRSMLLLESLYQYSDNSSTGGIEIISKPTGASIFLDGYHVGYTGEQGIPIEGVLTGRHKIKAVKSGYMDWVSDISISENRMVKIWIPLKTNPDAKSHDSTETWLGTIIISSEQTNASIYIDGKYAGTSPMTLTNILPGLHAVRIKKPGFKDWKMAVDVMPGKKHSVYAMMRIIPLKILEDLTNNNTQILENGSTNISYSASEGDYLLDIIALGIIAALVAFAHKKW